MANQPFNAAHQSGVRMFSGEVMNAIENALNKITGLAPVAKATPGYTLTGSAQDTITAKAGGGQASATQLASMVNRVTTVATAADSVMLPPSVAGQVITIVNAGANALQVFGLGSDTIGAAAPGTGVSQPAGKVAMYVCATAGAWSQMLSA